MLDEEFALPTKKSGQSIEADLGLIGNSGDRRNVPTSLAHYPNPRSTFTSVLAKSWPLNSSGSALLLASA